MIRAVRLLNLRRLRRQPLRAAITVIAVAAGVSLAVSVVIVTNSLNAAFEGLGRELAGPAPLRVIGATTRAGLEQSVLPNIEATPGVGTAVPVVQTVAMAEDSEGGQRPIIVFGIDCRVEALLGALGCDQAALDAAVDAPPLLSASLARTLGSTGAVLSDIGRIPVAGAPAIDRLDALNEGRVAVFPLPAAQRQFLRQGRLDAIYVTLEAGADETVVRAALEDRIGSQNAVLGADDPPPQAGVITIIFVPLFSMLSLLALIVGMILVYNTVSLSLEERRRQLAIVGALGARRGLLLGGTVAEAAGLGLVGGLLGVAGGIAVAYPVTVSLNDFTEKGLGMPVPVHVAPAVVVVGAVLGLLVGAASAVMPARRALRVDVAAELANRDLRSESAPGRIWRRAAVATVISVVGLVACLIGQRNGAIERWQATVAPVGFIVMVIGLAILVGALAPLALGRAAPHVVRAGAPARLGLANLAREPGRTGIMAVAIGLALGLGFVLATFNRSVREGVAENIGDSGGQWLRVSTLEPNNTINIDSAVPPSMIDALRRVPGVAEVQRSGGIVTGHDAAALIGVSGADGWNPLFPMLEGTFDEARYRAGEVMVGAGLARSTGARPGGTIRVLAPSGTVDLPVMGVWQNGDFGGRNVTMALPHIERVFGPMPTVDVAVRPGPGVSVDELARRVRSAGLGPNVYVHTPAQLADVVADDIANQLTSFRAIQRSLLFVAFVAVLSTLLLVGVQRRRELGLLAAVGMTPRDLAAMVTAEAGAVFVAGAGLGLLAGAVMCVGMMALFIVLVGYRDPLVFDLVSVPGTLALGVVIIVAAAAFPAWRTSRVEVVEALQYE